jgi:hypothetical protein
MSKVVFFTDLGKLPEAVEQFDIHGFAHQKVPVKIHMGEMKNKYYSKPELAKLVVDELKKVDADPFLHDTTVAYPGPRRSKTGYLHLAHLHGFTHKEVGCEVIIDDTGVPTVVEGRSFDVAEHLSHATHIVALSHVKGHIQTGMGGAIKNFGMGGVTRETKIRIHDGGYPVYQKDSCTYCGVCAERCPFHAIKVSGDSLKLSSRACFGCGVCVDVCKSNAFHFEDADLQYLLVCAAKACVQNKNVLYLNELKRIVKGCDCDPFAGPIICPDIGYLVGDDPVAIDKASLDRINLVKENVFEKINKVDPLKQIKYGEEIGLGSSSYELIEL